MLNYMYLEGTRLNSSEKCKATSSGPPIMKLKQNDKEKYIRKYQMNFQK